MAGGELVVIKRSGRDGMRYPLPSGYVTLGRDADCHIRVLLPSVSNLHATVTVHRNQSVLRNVSSSGETLVNGAAVSVAALRHGDVITLGDRSLRWEYYAPEELRAQPTADLPTLKMNAGKRRQGRGGRQRASDAAPRRLESEVKVLLELRHRTSLPVAGGERQVAIVQPQRRGETTAEPAEIKAKVVSKPTNKRASRSTQPASLNQSESTRKATRTTNSPAASLDKSKSVSPKKGTKKSAKTPNKTDTPAKGPKGRSSKGQPETTETNVDASTSKETPKNSNKDENKPDTIKKSDVVDTPRKSARKALNNDTIAAKDSPRIENPNKTPAKNKIGLDLSKVVPTDLAAVAARGTPKRQTPKGSYVHVATPRPKTPYVEKSPSSARASTKNVVAARGTPRVNPLLRAATLRATPRAAPKILSTPKTGGAKKRNVVEKIEDPTIIDAQKKSALMALTGRSPKTTVTPHGKISAKFIIAKASIKKISPSRLSPKRSSRGAGSGSKRKRVTGTPKLTPGPPVDTLKLYTPGSETGKGQKRSLRNSQTANDSIEIIDPTPAKLRKSVEAQPNPSPTRNSRRFNPDPPTSPKKSVLKTPSSPRKMENIKFDLSNLERKRSLSSPKKDSPKSTPSKTRGRSSVMSLDVTSEEDLLLRYSDESSGSESPSPRRSGESQTSHVLEKSLISTSVISVRLSRSRSPLSKSQSVSTPRISSRSSLLVQKVLETPVVVASPSPSDRSSRSSYSRKSTLTKSQYDASSVVQSPDKTLNTTRNVTITPEKTPNLTRNPKLTRQLATDSYSIVDLVSINTTHSVDETDSTYDSFSSVSSSINSRYGTPAAAKSGRHTTSRGRNMANISLETSTPMVKQAQRLSARSALLKSATIASAIKRSRSTPTTTRNTSRTNSATKPPNKRSTSLTLSPQPSVVNVTVDSKRSSRGKSKIVIDESALSVDSTITPSTRVSKRTSSRSANTTAESPISNQNSPSKSLSTSLNSPLLRVSRNDSKTSPSKKSPRLSRSNEESALHSPDASSSLKESKGQSLVYSSVSGKSPTYSNLSGLSVNLSKIDTPITRKDGHSNLPLSATSVASSARQTRSRITGQSPSNKRRSASLGDVPNASKRRSTFRGSKVSPRLQVGRHSGKGDSPSTPENAMSPKEAGTPVLNIQNILNQSQEAIKSVKETIKHFEAIRKSKASEQTMKATRKTLGAIGERILARRSDLERQGERRGWTDPKKKSKGITKNAKSLGKINLSAVKKVLSRTRLSKHGNDDNSVSSDKTDENAPKPNNEIVITPKSTVQLVPEAVKGKHSTAKKPISRKSIIDHLDISQDIVKNLFNSPVKRMLSQSMTQYSMSQLSDEEANISRRSKRSTLGKTPNVSFDFDSIKTPGVPTEMFVSPMDTPTPSSPNLVGVKRLYARNTPKNDLTNLRGVRALLKTPRQKKSPKNDLTNVAGVKALLRSTKKGKTPINDLTNISGVKELLGSVKKQRTPKNDLTEVHGVKGLFATGSKKIKSPKNDLRNVVGVKKLLKTPKGKPKSPKNDLTDVRGVKSVFRRNKSIRNALDDLSGIEELFGASSSTIRDPENTMTEFDKLVGKTPIKSYSRAQSFVVKKPTPAQQRAIKSLDADVSLSNVEEWLDKELAMRNKKRLSKSLNDTSIGIGTKTPERSIKISQPKSARLERALKKLTIDAVGGDISVTPDRRSRRVLTAEKSNYSIEVAKALTPNKKKLSIPETLEERSSLPFKKRGYSNERKSKTPKGKLTQGGLDNSVDELMERFSLPIKKRVLKSHGALGHSTPVKNRKAKSKADDADSVDLEPVSPIAASPNITPRKSTSLRDNPKSAKRDKSSQDTASVSLEENIVRAAKNAPARGRHSKAQTLAAEVNLATSASVNQEANTIKATNTATARGRNSKAQTLAADVDVTAKTPTPTKTSKARGRRGAKNVNVTTDVVTTPKKTTRSRKNLQNDLTGNTSKAESPEVHVVKPTRGRKANAVEQPLESKTSLKNPELKTKTRKAQNVSATNTSGTPSLVVSKKAPKLSPEKPQTKANRGRKAAPKAEEIKEPSPKKATRSRQKKETLVEIVPKATRGRKAAVPQSPPDQAPVRGRKATVSQSPSDQAPVRGRKATVSQSPSNQAPVRGSKATVSQSPSDQAPVRGRKATVSQSPVDQAPVKGRKAAVSQSTVDQAPARGRRKRQSEDEPDVSSPKVKPTRGRGRGAAGQDEADVSSPKVKPTRGRGRGAAGQDEADVSSPKVKPTRGRGRRAAGKDEEVKPESPKTSRGKKIVGSTQKHVSFAPEAPLSPPAPKRAGRRKLEPAAVEPEAEKPKAKRGRSGTIAANTPSPAKPAPRRSRQQPAAASPKAARATRTTRQRK